jgi:hypothetical protein
MSIRDEIQAKFRQARLERDEPTRNVITMLKSKVLERVKSAAGIVEDDALWEEVVQSYAKQLQKTIVELERAGERGAQALEETKFELAFCEQFLPKKLDERQTEALVRELADKHGLAEPKQMGQLMGMIMRDYKDQVDGQLVRKAAQLVLGGK